MAYNYEYPYTDTGRYNNDWLLNRVKQLTEEWLSTKEEWNNTEAEWQELQNYIRDYFNNLDVQSEINNKLDNMSNSGELSSLILPLVNTGGPQIVSSVGEMINNNTIYVLSTNNHIYYYNGSGFVDSGMSYASPSNIVTGALLFTGGSANAPFNDFNDIPVGSVYTIGGFGEMLNCPPNEYGNCTVLTYNYKNETIAGAVQILITTTGKFWFRMGWGATPTYNAWVELDGSGALSEGKLYLAANATPPYDDFNTLPVGSVNTIGDAQNMKNAPTTEGKAGTVITVNFDKAVGDGSFQLFYTTNGDCYTRIIFNGQWREWVNIAEQHIKGGTLYYGSQAEAPLNDFDTLPVGSIYSIGEVDTMLNAPSDATKGKGGTVITYNYTNKHNSGAVQILILTDGKFYYRISWGGGYLPWKSFSQSVEYKYPTPKPSFSMFEKFGVIGDSYASGGMVIDGEIVVNYNLSWVQVLRRLLGNEGVNYSFAGATTTSWLISENYGLPKLLSDEGKQCYIYALGINDATKTELGSIADITSNYNSNPNTFYGNTGRIIENVLNKNSKAKIIIMGIPLNTGNYVTYRNALKAIANHYNLPFIDPYSNSYFTSSTYTNMSGGHPLAIGYSGMANAINELLSDCMANNFNYFADYAG